MLALAVATAALGAIVVRRVGQRSGEWLARRRRGVGWRSMGWPRFRVGDVGALVWVAEQLEVVGVINRACGWCGGPKSVSLGEMVLAVAVQRACAPAGKCHLGAFLGGSIPRVSCLPTEAFTGQVFHRLAMTADEGQLESAQLELARAAASQFKLGADVLAFDTTNFDTHIATVTPGELARRGHAKSKRSDLRVVGLGVLVSETGHVPLFHRTYAGNASDHRVLDDCLGGRTDGAESGRRGLLHARVLAARHQRSGRGTRARVEPRSDEAARGQARGRARSALAHEGRRPRSHARRRREPGAARRPEARHRGGAEEGEEHEEKRRASAASPRQRSEDKDTRHDQESSQNPRCASGSGTGRCDRKSRCALPHAWSSSPPWSSQHAARQSLRRRSNHPLLPSSGRAACWSSGRQRARARSIRSAARSRPRAPTIARAAGSRNARTTARCPRPDARGTTARTAARSECAWPSARASARAAVTVAPPRALGTARLAIPSKGGCRSRAAARACGTRKASPATTRRELGRAAGPSRRGHRSVPSNERAASRRRHLIGGAGTVPSVP